MIKINKMSIPRSYPLQLVFSKQHDDFTCTAFHRWFFLPGKRLQSLSPWASWMSLWLERGMFFESGSQQTRHQPYHWTQAACWFQDWWQSWEVMTEHTSLQKVLALLAASFVFALESFRIKLTTNDSEAFWLTLSMMPRDPTSKTSPLVSRSKPENLGF